MEKMWKLINAIAFLCASSCRKSTPFIVKSIPNGTNKQTKTKTKAQTNKQTNKPFSTHLSLSALMCCIELLSCLQEKATEILQVWHLSNGKRARWLFRVYKSTIVRGLYIYMVYREYNYHLGYIIGCLGYIGDFTTQLCGDYFINHFTDPVIKHPGFNGK